MHMDTCLVSTTFLFTLLSWLHDTTQSVFLNLACLFRKFIKSFLKKDTRTALDFLLYHHKRRIVLIPKSRNRLNSIPKETKQVSPSLYEYSPGQLFFSCLSLSYLSSDLKGSAEGSAFWYTIDFVTVSQSTWELFILLRNGDAFSHPSTAVWVWGSLLIFFRLRENVLQEQR
jgi:hypothetical protein